MKKLHNDPPEQEWQEVSWHEFLKRSGAIEFFRNKGVLVNPTHDSTLLKGKRLELFGKAMADFIAERKKNCLETTEADLNMCYREWLEGEIKVVANWLSKTDSHDPNKPLHSASERIEIKKYGKWVAEQIVQVKQPVTSDTITEVQEETRSLSLADLITHDHSNDIVDGIKNQYQGIKGKMLKYLYLTLQAHEPPLLPIGRHESEFHRHCKNEFNWDVASLSAMNKYEHPKNKKDLAEYHKIQATIDHILTNLPKDKE